MGKRSMSFRDALDLVPDDLPDGAYWAMAHEMADLDYGDGFAELGEEVLGTVPSRKQRKERTKPPADRGERVCYSPTTIKAQAHKP